MARVLGQAGHKVILADKDITDGYSMVKFSKYIHKYIDLSVSAKTKYDYIQDLVQIWREENIDWFLPISRGQLCIYDVEAKNEMETTAILEGREFHSLCLNDSNLAKDLNENLRFLMECHDMGISVPDFKKLSDVPMSDLGMFKT